MVLQEVHLVDVEEAAVGPGEQPRLEGPLAAGERPLQVERADDPVLGGAERQVDHRHGPRLGPALAAAGAVRAGGGGRLRVAGIGAAGHRPHRRQQGGERPDRRGLAGAAIAQHQHAADQRIDRRDQQRLAHRILADEGREGEDFQLQPPYEALYVNINLFSRLSPRRIDAHFIASQQV